MLNYIGVGRFRILGGGGGGGGASFRILGGGGGKGGGPNSQQAHDDVTTSFRRRVPFRFLIGQCQIITFLILKYDFIENSRIEVRGIVLPVQMGGLLGGGQRVCCPPSQIIGGPAPPPPPPPPPSSYAYELGKHNGGKRRSISVVDDVESTFISVSPLCVHLAHHKNVTL